MNYLAAQQRKTDGRWDYARNGIPCGYCCFPDESRGGKWHTDGHATEAEARVCFKEYQLDNALRFTPEDMGRGSQFFRCQAPGCGNVTNGSARVGAYEHFTLCKDHQTRECVAEIYTVAEQSWQS